MNVDEFLANRDPGDESVLADSATSPAASDGDETKEDDFQHVTSLTPSGLEVLYSWAPKRLYRVRKVHAPEHAGATGFYTEWTDVPSVTSVLGVLDKPALPWWGMKVGIEGVLELLRREEIREFTVEDSYEAFCVSVSPMVANPATVENVVPLLTQHKLTVNHVKDKAADRGANVHGALESWAIDQSYRANPDVYEEHERGYIVGLNSFLEDLGECTNVQAEVMVGNLEHGYAGRYDLRLYLPEDRELVTKTYPKRADKREFLDEGLVLIDLKTSKDCYSSHSLQLAAYEQASIECGYGSTDYRAVLRVTADGKYEFRRANAEFSDFKAVLTAYTAMQRKAWFS